MVNEERVKEKIWNRARGSGARAGGWVPAGVPTVFCSFSLGVGTLLFPGWSLVYYTRPRLSPVLTHVPAGPFWQQPSA